MMSSSAGEPSVAGARRPIDVMWLYPSLESAPLEPQTTRRTVGVWVKALFGALRLIPG